jgi:hypothetical protein
MRHVILTCKNHPALRWSCKEIAFTDEGGYNGQRSIVFLGTPTGKGMHSDHSGLDCAYRLEKQNKEGKVIGYEVVTECECPAINLIRASEDSLVRRI